MISIVSFSQLGDKMAVTPLFLATAFFLLEPFLLGLTAEAWRTTVPAIYIFGDSVVDVGNNNYLQNASMDLRANYPHNGIDFPGQIPTGRFSNGYIGIDSIARGLGFHQSPPPFLSLEDEEDDSELNGVNFASGGSGILDATGPTVISLSKQIENFEAVRSNLERKLGKQRASIHVSKSLFLICSGSNDLSDYYSQFGSKKNATRDNLYIASLVLEFEVHLKELYYLGARKFAIFGLSQTGCIPFIRSLIPDGGCLEEINALASHFNQVAIPRMQLLSSTLSGLKYSYAKFEQIVTYIQSNAHLYGLKEIKAACCGHGKFNGESGCIPNATYCHNRGEYFFWDWSHPTQKISELMSVTAFNGSKEFSTPMTIEQLVEVGTIPIKDSKLPN